MSHDFDRSLSGAGPAQPGGCFHLSFRSGSRAGGASGAATFDYITRDGPYDEPERDPAIFTESGHKPEWAAEDPAAYWEAADQHERANGRLFVSADFALPRELTVEQQVELARAFARELTDDERLPYTLAVHEGLDADGTAHNPHAHLMFSERQNDGVARSPDQWFRRANSADPEHGGAPKSRTFHGAQWVEQARSHCADLTNEALARAGSERRVDHRSYARQGVDREPGEHYGPEAPHMLARGVSHERFDAALAVADRDQAIHELEAEIAAVERSLVELAAFEMHEDRSTTGRGQSGAERDDDHSWGR